MARMFTREEFHQLVWSKPLTQLAREFGMSDVALHKICRKHDVPHPPLGWWAKHAAGHEVEVTPLPAAPAGTSDRITIAGGDLAPEPDTLRLVRERARIAASSSADVGSSPDPIVERTIGRLMKARPAPTGIVSVEGGNVVRTDVAAGSVARVGEALALLVAAARLQGFRLKAGERCAVFTDGEETVDISVREGLKREKHALTASEITQEEKWRRRSDRPHCPEDWRTSFDRPRFPEWDHNPTGLVAIEFEQVYLPNGPSPRRSWRDAKVQRLEAVAEDMAVGLAVIAAAKGEARRLREEAARQHAERRRLHEAAQRAKHVEERRGKALDGLLSEMADLERLQRLVASLRRHVGQEPTPRVTTLLSFAEDDLTSRVGRLTPEELEKRFDEDRLFGGDDDHAFRPTGWGY